MFFSDSNSGQKAIEELQVDVSTRSSQDNLQIHGPECVRCLWYSNETGLCNQSFLSVIDFHKHIYIHASEASNNSFVCSWLNCSHGPYKTKKSLIPHLQCHIEITSYICNICKNYFKIPSYLSRHIARHNQMDAASEQTTTNTSKS